MRVYNQRLWLQDMKFNKEVNLTDVNGDGRIVIYQRTNRNGTVSPNWNMRIRVPNSTGYFRGSTR